jgi:signal transduction histidine kinase
MTNIRKHAGAGQVVVALRADPDGVELAIEDDGAGFDVAPADATGVRTSFGMTGMAERAALVGGELTIRSAPGRGTSLSVRIPHAAEAAT